MKRITSITKQRFRELCQQWIDGILQEKWPEGKVAITKAEQVEERQIRAIGLIYSSDNDDIRKLLFTDKWRELYILQDDKNIRIQIK
jgi:hypothetical protein